MGDYDHIPVRHRPPGVKVSKPATPAPLPEWLVNARNTNWTMNVRLHVTGACGRRAELCRLCRGKIPPDCGGKMLTRREVGAAVQAQRAAEKEAKRDPTKRPKAGDKLAVSVESMQFGHPKGDVVEVVSTDTDGWGKLSSVTFRASWWTGQRFTFTASIGEWRKFGQTCKLGRAS